MTFAYTESTNIVVATNGTSGTPLTSADFVIADRAGTNTDLLVAGSPGSALALTYAVRPVEDLAILVKCIVANKTAEADFIFITGTDWRGAAQTESIDVTAGNGSYTSTKYWATITTLDCSDNANGGGTVWADGDLSVTQDIWGVIWDYGNGQYQIDYKLEIGDGSTSTYFASESESVTFTSNLVIWRCPFNIKAAATLRIGKQVNGEPQNGSRWVANDLNAFASFIINENSSTAVIEIYGSIIEFGGSTASGKEFAGVTKIQDSCLYTTITSGWTFTQATSEFDNVFLNNGTLYFSTNPNVMTKLHHDLPGYAGFGNQTAGVTITAISPEITNPTFVDHTYRLIEGSLIVRNPLLAPTQSTCTINDAESVLYLEWPVDIHIADKDGVNLSGAAVTMHGSDTSDYDTQRFSVNTAADGTITTQNVNSIKWTGTSKVETDYNLHKFTVSKAGYETLILDNITVDDAIDWHLELQPIKHPIAAWADER